MRVRTRDGKEGKVIKKNDNSSLSLIQFDNGKQRFYPNNQLTELTTGTTTGTKPPSRERDALISKYQTMLDECRNEGAKAVLVMILNDLR